MMSTEIFLYTSFFIGMFLNSQDEHDLSNIVIFHRLKRLCPQAFSGIRAKPRLTPALALSAFLRLTSSVHLSYSPSGSSRLSSPPLFHSPPFTQPPSHHYWLPLIATLKRVFWHIKAAFGHSSAVRRCPFTQPAVCKSTTSLDDDVVDEWWMMSTLFYLIAFDSQLPLCLCPNWQSTGCNPAKVSRSVWHLIQNEFYSSVMNRFFSSEGTELIF